MMPAPGRISGSWCERYLTSQELNKFIRRLFESSGKVVGNRKLTTHSFKATSLSWCAKHGVSGETQGNFSSTLERDSGSYCSLFAGHHFGRDAKLRGGPLCDQIHALPP